MSQINELIAKLCPNGVEWKTLGEVCDVFTGGEAPGDSIKEKKPRGQYIYPIYSNGVGENALWGFAKSYRIDKMSVTFSSIGTIGYPTLREAKFIPIIRLKVIIPKEDSILSVRFLKYALDVIQFGQNKSSVPNINANMIKSLQIPLPPLEIQNRIVEILDHFTNLTANLTAELNLRRKQFEHYLDVFFGENEDTMESLAKEKNIEIKALQDLGTLTRGRRFVRDDIRTEGVPCIHYGDMYTTYGIAEQNTITFLDEEKANKLRFAEPNDVVIVGAGENDWDIGVGLAWFGKQNVVVHDACYIYKHNLNPKFVSYYLRSNNYHLQIRKWVSSGKISAISDKNLGKAKIPFYAKEAQQSIVEKLDKFTALIENIEKELDLRQKQYEYYREQLLSFQNS